MSRAEALLDSFDSLWQQFSKSWKKATEKGSDKSIHDLRVNARRLVATVELAQAVSQNGDFESARHRLKKVLKSTGRLRDVQVQLTILDAHSRFDVADFKDHLERRERRALRRTYDNLTRKEKRHVSRGIHHVRRELGELQSNLTENTLTRAIEGVLHGYRGQFLKARRNLKPSDEKTLHKTRIALKTWRYAIEAARPAMGNAITEHTEEMRARQQLMGDARDLSILHADLDKWATKKDCRREVTGVLKALEDERQNLVRKVSESLPTFIDNLYEAKSRPVVEKTHAARPKNQVSMPAVSSAAFRFR